LPLHLASNSHVGLPILKVLLENDIDAQLQAEDKEGLRPLHLAIQNGYVDSVKELVEAGGADELRVIDKKGRSLIRHIAESPHYRCKEELCKYVLMPRIIEGDFTEFEASDLVRNEFYQYDPSEHAIEIAWAFVNCGFPPSIFPDRYQEPLRIRSSQYRTKSARNQRPIQ